MSEFYITPVNFRVGTDWFRFFKSRKSKYDLHYLLRQVNLDKYIIFKATRSFREVSVNDLYEFEYASYIMFDKEIHRREDINRWIEFVRVNDIGVRFLDKPFPSAEYMDKIKIIQ